MKKVIAILALINVCLLAMLASMAFLAETYPLDPGERFYAVQHSAEQWRLRLVGNPARRADFSVELAERRLADLAMAETDTSVSASAKSFDAALNTAIRSLDSLSDEQQSDKYAALTDLVRQADIVISALQGREEILASTHEKLHAIMALEDEGEIQDLVPVEMNLPTRITGVVISFLGKDVEHVDFPLTMGHADLECADCHADGEYVNTPVECSGCHTAPVAALPGFYAQSHDPIPAQIYWEHLEGECSDCHDTGAWRPSEYDHEDIQECRACHHDDLPKPTGSETPLTVYVSFNPKASNSYLEEGGHYPGECALCHTDTESWETYEYEHVDGEACLSCHESVTPPAHFPGKCETCHQDFEEWTIASAEHDQAKDCLSCHLDDFPYDHYAGQCADCHNTLNWSQATFNHTNYYDCRTCHITPRHHYKGQCSDCHDQAGWEVKNFDHTGQSDCKDCHKAPGGHASGQCSLCHTIQDWEPAKIDHSEFANCSACHNDETPGGHYIEACSLCHSVGEWTDAKFNHEGVGACEDCHKAPGEHYGGSCANCHGTNSWADANFDHSGYSDCLSCHATPTGHYLGQCSNCHTTQNWGASTFDHTGLVDCISCHTAAEDHYPGQCSVCHSTANWVSVAFDHTDADNCTGCHTAPGGHWPGQCSSCHFTDTWENIQFDHSNYTNCKSCHVRPAGHARGQCSNCHTTESWIIPTATPAAYDALIPWLRATPEPADSGSLPVSGDDENAPKRRDPVPDQEVLPSTRP